MTQPLRVIWGYRWWLLCLVVVAGAAAYLASDRQTREYDSEALVQIVSGQQAAGQLLSQEELLNITNIYAELAQTTPVIEDARKRAEFPGSRAEFEGHLSVKPEQDLGVLHMVGQDPVPDRAADYANAYAAALQASVARQQDSGRDDVLKRVQDRADAINDRLRDDNLAESDEFNLRAELQTLQSRIADELLRPADSIRVIQTGTASSDPVSPKPVRDAIAAAIVALLLGSLLAYARARATDRYSSADDAAADLQLPVLAQVPEGSTDDYASHESLRSLRTRIEFALNERPNVGTVRRRGDDDGENGRLLLVTSAEPGAGKTFISANLSRVLAAGNRTVIAVDGDLRRPSLHKHFRIPIEPGLRDALIAGTTVPPERLARSIPRAESDSPSATGDLRVLPAGSSIDNSSDAISSPRMLNILDQLRTGTDYVVTDSPPILAVTDAAILNLYVDGVLLVLDARKTRRRDARRTVQTLNALDARVLGIVFNRAETAEIYPYFYGRRTELEGSGVAS